MSTGFSGSGFALVTITLWSLLLVAMFVLIVYLWKRCLKPEYCQSMDQIRATVFAGRPDPFSLSRIKEAGFNTVVTTSEVDVIESAARAGLNVISFISTDDVRKGIFPLDAIEQPNFIGFHYLDPNVEEGMTSSAIQRQTYDTLKKLCPNKLVLFPLRLDLVSQETFLDEHFVPEATDMIVPYYYPVGTSILGWQHYEEPWMSRLSMLIIPVYTRLRGWQLRTGHKKEVMPLLQGFIQDGYPVPSEFVEDQYEVYRHYWPIKNLAVFSWDKCSPIFQPLSETVGLFAGTTNLLRSLGGSCSVYCWVTRHVLHLKPNTEFPG